MVRIRRRMAYPPAAALAVALVVALVASAAIGFATAQGQTDNHSNEVAATSDCYI